MFKISFGYMDPIPPEVTWLFNLIGVALLINLLVFPVQRLLIFLGKGLIDLLKEGKEIFKERNERNVRRV